MRRRLTRAVLFLGFLSVSAFAQTTQTVRGAQFLYFEPSRTSMEWSSVSVGEFWSASNNRTETEGLTAGTNSCLRANSLLQEVIVWDRDPLDPRIVPIWQLPENSAFLFISRMTIDADGAPNAYSRDDRGLDDLSNAGAPGRWNGIVTDKAGDPLLQRPDDPFPGYYISCTSLSDETKKFTDPTGYVDASKIPYVAYRER